MPSGVAPRGKTASEGLRQKAGITVEPSLGFHKAEEEQPGQLGQRPRAPIIQRNTTRQQGRGSFDQGMQQAEGASSGRIEVDRVGQGDRTRQGVFVSQGGAPDSAKKQGVIVGAWNGRHMNRRERDGHAQLTVGPVLRQQDSQQSTPSEPPGALPRRARIRDHAPDGHARQGAHLERVIRQGGWYRDDAGSSAETMDQGGVS